MNHVQMRLTKTFTELVSPTNSGEKFQLFVSNIQKICMKNALKKTQASVIC